MPFAATFNDLRSFYSLLLQDYLFIKWAVHKITSSYKHIFIMLIFLRDKA